MDRYNEEKRFRQSADLLTFIEDEWGDGYLESDGDFHGPGHFIRWEPAEDSYVIIESDPAIHIVGAIVHTDNFGNKDLTHYSSAVEFEKEWENIGEMLATWYDDEEDEEEEPETPQHVDGGLLDELRQAERWAAAAEATEAHMTGYPEC